MARSKTSLKRIKGLLFLMLLTMILAITATYAWFSTQRDVEITGMRLNVEVAESMQISLDGEKWTQSIQIADMRQFYGSYTGTGDSFTIYQAKAIDSTAGTGNNNYVPTELLPVSSAGEVVNGKLQLYTGTYTGSGIDDVAACTETELDTKTTSISDRQGNNEKHPYLVFDMYLRNISAKTGTNKDTLLLNQYSNVFVNTATTDDTEQEGKGTEGTGLEYSARVGMIVYGNTVSVNATDDVDGNGDVTKTVGEKIRELTSVSTDTAAIWEPNDKEHTAYVLSNTNMTIAADGSVTTLALNANAVGQDLTNLTTGTYLTGVNTMKPTYVAGTGTTSGVQTATAITDINNQAVGLLPNTISKVRVYVWLEGQDPDCIDLASTGDKLSINLKLTKEETEDGDGNTYVGEGTGGSGSGSGSTTLASVTNANIGDYIDLGNNVVGTTATTDDWRILYTEGNTVYAILADYLPNSTNYVTNAELDTYSTYNVYSNTDSDTLLTGLTTSSNWRGLTNGITGATATGTPTAELLMNSYNTKNGTSLDYTDEPILDSSTEEYDLYVPHTSDIDSCYGYWLASPYEGYTHYVWYVDYNGGVYNDRYYATDNGVRPVVALPSSTSVTKDGETWLVSNTGSDSGTGTTGLTAATLTTDAYGATVTNYASSSSAAQQSVNWRIFHTDGTNIYLIADDYVETQYIPAGKGNTVIDKDGTYGVYFDNVVSDYTGTADIASELKTKWLSQCATYTSTDENAKVTAYLMDTSVWKPVFVNSNYAEYAIGGPTIELFTASYNTTHSSKTIQQTIETGSGDFGCMGYKVKWSTDASYGYSISGLGTTEDIYVINDTTDASATWIASPTAEDSSAVWVVSSEGALDCYFFDSGEGYGIRPIICLKSTTKLEKQADGTYLIIE